MTVIAITGSTGYVGAAIAARALTDGHNVLGLGRRPSDRLRWRSYELAEAPSPDLVSDVEVVVHCAYDLSLTRPHDIRRVNVEGTRRLVDAATTAGARFVLISSMSAYPGTSQLYGRAKLASEQAVLAAGGKAVRLGLVYGDDGQGMVGALQRLIALPITPVIGRRAHQFTVHVDDMVSGVLQLALAEARDPEVIGLAHPQPVMFGDLLVGLATRSHVTLRSFDVPWRPVYGAMRLAEALHVHLPLRADSILGLMRPAPLVPHSDRWSQLGVRVRAFDEWARS